MWVQSSKFKVQSLERAFTLIELLVVLAVILILAALLLPVLANARARSIRMQCLNNVKQVDLLMLMYGHENSDRLPATMATYLLPQPVVDIAVKGGINHRIFYDPGRVEEELLGIGWWFKPSSWFSNDYAPYGRAIGYCLAIPGAFPLSLDNMNTTIIPQPVTKGPVVLPPPNASERVLVAGMTQALRTNGGFVFAIGAHMDHKAFLLGDNIATLDGGAKWRKFRDMVSRTYNLSGGEGYIWW
jgi:prepilin-type N-terminal cleavage/methylation domain-containing protein